MINKDRTLDVIKGLRRLGVHISLDDFGTGYSSLHYLNEFPVDKSKLTNLLSVIVHLTLSMQPL